jgi:hypothetical protein
MAQKPGFLKRMFQRAAAPLLLAGVVAGVGTIAYQDIVPTSERVTVTGTSWALLNDDEGVGFTKTIYKTDKGDLTNVINPWMGKFTRGGIADKIEVGKTYDVSVQGISFPLFGYYPNILSAKQVPPAPK